MQMPKEVVAALIAAAASLTVAFVPLIWNAVTAHLAKHLSSRRNVLKGRWEGLGVDFFVEDSRKEAVRFEVRMEFTVVGRTIRATAVLVEVGVPDDEVECTGAFYNDDYLHLSYRNKNHAAKQQGVLVIALNSQGTGLTGFYSGYSSRRETIVSGRIDLSKRT
jgi:hypothetical protein